MQKMMFLFLVCFTFSAVFSQVPVRQDKLNEKKDIPKNVKNDLQQKKDSLAKAVYTCPMHANVVQEKAGKCPECKMTLVKKEITKSKYTCPMHEEVVQDKPGKCPKCKMNLKEKTPAGRTSSKTAS